MKEFMKKPLTLTWISVLTSPVKMGNLTREIINKFRGFRFAVH